MTTTTESGKDAFFEELARISDAMTQAYGKDFAMGALVLAARFIAEKEGSATAPATVGTVHVASH